MSDDKHGPRPSLRPTAPSTLAVSALAGGSVTLLLVARYYQRVPELAWYNSVVIVVLAGLLAWMAWTTGRTLRPSRGPSRQRAAERPGTGAPAGTVRGPEHALQIARFAVLAKAAAIAGAVFFGAYLGFAIWLGVQSDRLAAASEDLPGAVFGTVACAALTAAAMWLEYSCRIPPSEDDDDEHSPD